MFIDCVCEFLRKQAQAHYAAAEKADGDKKIELRTLAANFDAAALVVKRNEQDMTLHSALNYINKFGQNETTR